MVTETPSIASFSSEETATKVVAENSKYGVLVSSEEMVTGTLGEQYNLTWLHEDNDELLKTYMIVVIENSLMATAKN